MGSLFHVRLRQQLAEVFGPVNRWYCAQAYGCQIDDPDLLLEHFCKTGGAVDFAARWDKAMDSNNRWFCSEFHRHDIRDPEILWTYFNKYRLPDAAGNDGPPSMNLAC